MPVFVLTTGTILVGQRIRLRRNRITYSLIGGGTGVISTNDVDWTSTTQLNAQRGLRVTLHNSPRKRRTRRLLTGLARPRGI